MALQSQGGQGSNDGVWRTHLERQLKEVGGCRRMGAEGLVESCEWLRACRGRRLGEQMQAGREGRGWVTVALWGTAVPPVLLCWPPVCAVPRAAARDASVAYVTWMGQRPSLVFPWQAHPAPQVTDSLEGERSASQRLRAEAQRAQQELQEALGSQSSLSQHNRELGDRLTQERERASGGSGGRFMSVWCVRGGGGGARTEGGGVQEPFACRVVSKAAATLACWVHVFAGCCPLLCVLP